jgi:hypothetical protein
MDFLKWVIQMCMIPYRILTSSDVSEDLKLVSYKRSFVFPISLSETNGCRTNCNTSQKTYPVSLTLTDAHTHTHIYKFVPGLN